MKRLYSQDGVTLLELVLCIIMLGIMGYVASPILGNSTSHVNLDAAAKQVEADLRYAQNMATTTSNNYKWEATSASQYQVVEVVGATETVATSPYDHQPMNVDLSLSYPNTTFNSAAYSTTFTGSSGSATPLSIVLTNSVTGASKTIMIKASGNINVQ